MRRIDVGVQEHDCDAVIAVVSDVLHHRARSMFIERLDDAAVGADALHHCENVRPVDQRGGFVEIEIIHIVALLPPDQDDVAKSRGGDEGGARSLAFQNGVGSDRRGVYDAGDLFETKITRRNPLGQCRLDPNRRLAARRYFPDPDAARALVVENVIGEGAADIEGQTQHQSTVSL